jgi:short subunit dehydrogenase-like uncharacterized protein
MSRPFDVVVWGASGFTGRLVAEHLVRDYSNGKSKVNWALAGRSKAKLEQIRDELSETYGNKDIKNVPILTFDANDQASIEAVVSQTKAVVSTAGPFTLIGTPLVDAAVKCGTHYADITGETTWVKKMIDKHHDTATEKNVRIVNCCGYDSIPFDMAAYMMSNYIKTKLGKDKKLSMVLNIVGSSRGGVSGGTIASGLHIFSELSKSKAARDEASNVYSLSPNQGDDKEFWGTAWNDELKTYLGPFIMQAANAKIVHRSNYFLNYGPHFHYQEAIAAPNWMVAKAIDLGTKAIVLLMSQTLFHPLLKKMLPKQGEGPSRDMMLNGYYNHKVVGYVEEGDKGGKKKKKGSVLIGKVADKHRDGGYWGTSRMLLEAGLCMALQGDELNADGECQKGGVLTPASAMGKHLLERLRRAGMEYEVTEVVEV